MERLVWHTGPDNDGSTGSAPIFLPYLLQVLDRQPFGSGRIFNNMHRKFSIPSKTAALSIAGVTLVLFFVVLAIWRILPFEKNPSEATSASIVKFEYCGAELQEFCLLSFGRDADGNAIINLFVPNRDFPDFYLRISRLNGENVYVCLRNEEALTSVVCMGDVINLNERIEISVMSAEDFRLLLLGKFTVKAILISTQPEAVDATQTPLSPSPSPEAWMTETPFPVDTIEAETSTPTALDDDPGTSDP